MLVVKGSTGKQNQSQTGGRKGLQVGMGSAPSGDQWVLSVQNIVSNEAVNIQSD